MCVTDTIGFSKLLTVTVDVWESGPVDDTAIALLCGDADIKLPASSMVLDRKLKLHVPPKVAYSIKQLRAQYARLFQQQMKMPGRTLSGVDAEWWKLVVQAISSPPDESIKKKQHATEITIR